MPKIQAKLLFVIYFKLKFNFRSLRKRITSYKNDQTLAKKKK